MTMLSAQPITLTGEQHDSLWRLAKDVRENVGMSVLAGTTSDASARPLYKFADAIERILIDAQDAAPPATAA